MSQGRTKEAWGLDVGEGSWALVRLIGRDGRFEIAGCTVRPYDHPPELPNGVETVIVDAPIGLVPDDRARRTKTGLSGGRPVDVGARLWCLRSGSVFPAPTVGQLAAGLAEHRRAQAASTKADRRRRLANVSPGGMSAQTLELLPAIASAETLKACSPTRVYESHPEVVFAALAKGIVPFGKKRLSGLLLRVALLEQHLRLRGLLRDIIRFEKETRIGAGDWLDALAMAAVAADWSQGSDRLALHDERGSVLPWQARADALIALPRTRLDGPPGPLSMEAASALIDPLLAALPGETHGQSKSQS